MLALVVESNGCPPLREAGLEVATWRDERDEVFARAYADGTSRWIEWPGVGTFTFTPDAPVVRVWPSPGGTADHLTRIEDVFRTAIVPVARQALGAQALHASAVLGAAGVLAFAGLSSSGKSTVATALARAGYPHVADDHVVLVDDEGLVSVDVTASIPRLRPSARHHFDTHAGAEVSSAAPGRYALAGVIILEQSASASNEPEVVRQRGTSALRAILPHAHCFAPNQPTAAETLVTAYQQLVSRVPIYRCAYPPRLSMLPALVAAIVRIAPGAASTAIPDSEDLR